MASTTEALGDEELARLRRAAVAYVPPEGYFRGMDPRGYIEFFLLTGAHPSVLADPAKHDLRTEDRPGGRLSVTWLRPKKTGMAARCEMQFGPTERWMREFVDGVRASPRSDRQIGMLVRAVAASARIEGPVSPRTLRHTCGVLMLRRSRNPSVVKDLLNVSDRTLQHYLRLTNEDAQRAVEGFLPPLRESGSAEE